MGVKKKNEKRIKKEEYWSNLWELTDKYSKGILVDADNVSSLQINYIRRDLRAIGAVMLMGKNVSSALFITWSSQQRIVLKSFRLFNNFAFSAALSMAPPLYINYYKSFKLKTFIDLDQGSSEP